MALDTVLTLERRYNLVRVQLSLDNKAIAHVFYETADLMEINGDDCFRIRSYARAAEALEASPDQVSSLLGEPKKLLEVPGHR